MSNCKEAPTPILTCLRLSKDDDGSIVDPKMFKRLVGSLMYLTETIAYIMYGVSLESRFMESPKYSHWKACKRIMRYVSGTKDLGIMYPTSENFKLIGYTHNDNGGNRYDMKRTSGYTFYFGMGVVSWAFKKQPLVTMSLAEVEYVVATCATCQDFWM